jgi:pimeloyl-ACP methyl ester carboxylesterase
VEVTVLRDAAHMLGSGPAAAELRPDMQRVERRVRWADTERDLDRLSCPTLILWGERDRYFPVRLLDRFTRRTRHAGLTCCPDAGTRCTTTAPSGSIPC